MHLDNTITEPSQLSGNRDKGSVSRKGAGIAPRTRLELMAVRLSQSTSQKTFSTFIRANNKTTVQIGEKTFRFPRFHHQDGFFFKKAQGEKDQFHTTWTYWNQKLAGMT